MSIREQTPLQRQFYRVIFGTETPAGKWFDICLIVVILASVMVVMLDSIPDYHQDYARLFLQIEWGFTLLFTLEYLIRLWCAPNRKGYALSIYGVVDLLALLPTYISLFLPQAASLLIIRLLRILRIFRVLRLLSLLDEANDLARALHNSTRKIFVFFSLMIILATIFGCLIYVIEGPEHGFNSIPHSIYWAIVTITTVGYGDLVPLTNGHAASSGDEELLNASSCTDRSFPSSKISALLKEMARFREEDPSCRFVVFLLFYSSFRLCDLECI